MTLEEAIAAIAELREENLRLRVCIADFETRLKFDSITSAKPPSSAKEFD